MDMKDEQKDGAGRVIARVSLDEHDQEKASYLAERYKIKKLPSLFRYLVNATFAREQENDLRYGAGRTARAGARETRDDATRRIRAMNIDQLNEYLLEIGYILPFKEEMGTGDIVERERVVPHETTGAPVLETQHYSPSTHAINYRATTLNLDQMIAELIKNKMI